MDNTSSEAESGKLPPKSSDLWNHHCDSRQWDLVEFRVGDVLVGTYPKSGTTWMQQIVRYLIDAPADVPIAKLSPWVDSRLTPRADILALARQPHRRAFKHHLAQSCLPTAARDAGCFVYVARDGRDVAWSLYNFHRRFTPEYIVSRNKGEFEGPEFPPFDEALDEAAYFERWLARDGYPFWPFWDNIRSWWRVRHHPRVFFCHYQKLAADTRGEIARLLEFLRKYGDVRAGDADAVVAGAAESSSFDAMKKNAHIATPGNGVFLTGGKEAFFNKGTNARWRGKLSDELVHKYEETARRELGEECAHWLATGEFLE